MESVAIKFVGRTPKPRSAFVGMHGEHNVEQVVFTGIPEFEDSIVTMNVVLPNGTAGDTLNVDDNTVVLTRTYTQMSGQWTAWIVVQVGTEMVWKSDVFRLIVMPLPEIEEIMDQQYPTALEEMLAKADEAIASAGAAAQSAGEAAASANDAAGAASLADTYAGQAGGYAESARTSMTQAQAAKGAAEEAVAGAVDAKGAAIAYAAAAENARDGAVSAKTAAEQAKTGAEAAKNEAARYAEAADGSAGRAAASADTASGHASTASSQAARAETAADGAERHETNAEAAADDAGLHDLSAEAWAVGTKSGQAVPSGEAQYQNNAKYWAQEAESTAEELREAMEDLPQETTGEALLEALIHGTDMTDTVLTVAGMYLDALPQDESGTDIRDALHLEADRLAALYEIWEAERS